MKKTNGKEVTDVQSDVAPSRKHADEDKEKRVQALVNRFHQVRVDREHEIDRIVSEFKNITPDLDTDFSPKSYSVKQNNLAILLAKKTENMKRAATLLKMPISTLNNWIREDAPTGLGSRGPFFKEQKEIAIQLARLLGSVEEAAKLLGVSRKSLGYWYDAGKWRGENIRSRSSYSDEQK